MDEIDADASAEDTAILSALIIDAGATLADFQPQETWRVLFDPAGHPFCLFT